MPPPAGSFSPTLRAITAAAPPSRRPQGPQAAAGLRLPSGWLGHGPHWQGLPRAPSGSSSLRDRLSRSSLATTRVALRALLGPLYPTAPNLKQWRAFAVRWAPAAAVVLGVLPAVLVVLLVAQRMVRVVGHAVGAKASLPVTGLEGDAYARHAGSHLPSLADGDRLPHRAVAESSGLPPSSGMPAAVGGGQGPGAAARGGGKEEEVGGNRSALCSSQPHADAAYPSDGRGGTLRPQGLRTFLFLSSHRVSIREFAVIGLLPAALRGLWQPASSPEWRAAADVDEGSLRSEGDGCLWLSFDGPQTLRGSMEFLLPGGAAPDESYEPVVVRCLLPGPAPAAAGGALFLRLHGTDALLRRETPLQTPPPKPPPQAAGLRFLPLPRRTVQQQPHTSAQQQKRQGQTADAAEPRLVEPLVPPPHQASACLHLGTGEMEEALLQQQLVLLSLLGFSQFLLYLDAPHHYNLAHLARAASSTSLSVVLFDGLWRVPVNRLLVSANDCLYRTAFSSQWALALPAASFPVVPPQWTLPALLDSHKGRPWLAVTEYSGSTQMCLRPEKGGEQESPQHPWLLERMQWRAQHPSCLSTTASLLDTAVLGAASAADDEKNGYVFGNRTGGGKENREGRGEAAAGGRCEPKRHIIFNVRKVKAVGPSGCLPTSSKPGGALAAETMRVLTFHGLATPAAPPCERILPAPATSKYSAQQQTERPLHGTLHQQATGPLPFIHDASLATAIAEGRKAGLFQLT